MNPALDNFLQQVLTDGYMAGEGPVEEYRADLLKLLGFTREHVKLLREVDLDWDGPFEWVKNKENGLLALADLIESYLPPEEE